MATEVEKPDALKVAAQLFRCDATGQQTPGNCDQRRE
jgi:hypothetical protein